MVGTIRYSRTNRITARTGKKSRINEKNKTSAIKNRDPGKPKNINKLTKISRKSFVLRRPIEETSVINRVLNLLLIQSTNKKKFVDKNA